MDSESRYESAEEVQFSLGSLPNLIEKAAVRDLFVDHAGLIRHDTANAPCSHVFVEFCSIDSMPLDPFCLACKQPVVSSCCISPGIASY